MRLILHRYIFREITVPFVLILLLLTFVLLMGRMLQLMDLMVNKGIGVWDIGRLILYLMPYFLMFTIPISLLVSILIGLGRLSGDNEITVMKAAGIGLYQILVPVAIASACAFLITALTSLYLVPWGNFATKNLLFELAMKKATIAIKEKVFNDDFEGILIYAEKVPPDGSLLEGVMIQDNRVFKEPSTIFAKRAYLVSDMQTMSLTLRLEDGSTHTVDPSLKSYKKLAFSSYDIHLDLSPTGSGGQNKLAKASAEMTVPELLENLQRKDLEQTVLKEMAIELHKKLSIPLSCLVFGLLGIPLGIRAHRSVRARGFTLGLLIVLVYYVFQLTGDTFVEMGKISPFVGTWAPNLFFGVLGLGLLVMTAREISLGEAAARLLSKRRDGAAP